MEPDFWFSRPFFWAVRQYCLMSEKYITKISGICVWQHISSPNFHRMCVLSIHTFWCIDLLDVTKSYGRSFDFIAFFGYFSNIIDENLCLKYSIFIELSQIMCLMNVHILLYQHAKCDCSLKRVLWFNCIFGNFHTYNMFQTL